jgi:2,3-bisphosphoglycerate-dependent phosphoglycerate mutase
MANLILIRHGESLWNAKGLWTGLTDIGLSANGILEAKKAGEKIRRLDIDICYTSVLKRAKQTLDEILKVLRIKNIPVFANKALNERDYGIYTGKNKWEIKKALGDGEFIKLRRGWDNPIENGESLKNVYERVVPYYNLEILPNLKKGKSVLISAHGNSLRALVKHLENISDQNVEKLEIATGEVYLYEIDNNGNIESKEIL